MGKIHSQECNLSQGGNKTTTEPAKKVRTVVVKNAIVSEKTIDNVFDELTDAIELLEHLPIPEKEQEKIHDRISLAYKQMHNYLCQEINKYASVLEADIASRQKELDSQQVLLDQARKYLGQKRD